MDPRPTYGCLGSQDYPTPLMPGWPPQFTLEDDARPVIGDLLYEPRRFTSHRRPQFVWPRDKNQSFGGRLKDVLKGKGPDIFINRRGDPGPHRSIWSGWNGYGLTGNINEYGRPTEPALWTERNALGERESAMPPFKSAERRFREGQVYDFHGRKYTSRGSALWSDARRSRQDPRRVLYTRDSRGFEINQGGFPENGWSFGRYDGRRPETWIRLGAEDGYGGWNEEDWQGMDP